jgi:hypothetical protein
MSTLEEIKVVEPEPEKKRIKIGPETDPYKQVKLPETTDLRFHQYVEDIDNFKDNVNFATRLRRGLMHNGSDNPDRGTVVIAFRGTVTNEDKNTDRVFLLRNNPITLPGMPGKTLAETDRYMRNRQFIIQKMNTYFNGEAVNGSNSYWDFYVTGHSLGGALSEVLSMDKLVHGGYSFSPPVDSAVNKHAYGDINRPFSASMSKLSLNAPTFRSINKMDKVIGGLTDATTGGDVIYDNVIQGTVYNPNKGITDQMLGHELSWFKDQKTTTPFDVPPYAPGQLQRNITGPIETTRRTLEYIQPAIDTIPKPVTNVLKSGYNQMASLLNSGRRQPLLPVFGRGKGRCWKGCKPTPGRKPYSKGSCTCTKKRGRGPPPSYPLSLSLAKDAYSENFDAPQKHEIGRHEAILCPAPISNQEVKFYVCRWPRFNSDEERDEVIGPKGSDLVTILTSKPMEYVTPYDKPKNFMNIFKESEVPDPVENPNPPSAV